jgi:hypothetical protein
MKMKRRIIIAATLVLLALVARSQLGYPQGWGDIHVGMTRSQVYNIVGAPNGSCGEIKGCFWYNEKLIGWQELWIDFEGDDKVSSMSLKQYIGTKTHFFIRRTRYESRYSP